MYVSKREASWAAQRNNYSTEGDVCHATDCKLPLFQRFVPSVLVSGILCIVNWNSEWTVMHVLITRNSSSSEAVDASLLLVTYLSSQNIQVTMLDARDTMSLNPYDYDLMVALGGDGTMLHAAHFAQYSKLPILGLNFGHLGFLANDAAGNVVAAVAAALSGDVVRSERTNLRVDVLCEGDDVDAFEAGFLYDDFSSSDRIFFGLNEATVSHGLSGKIIDVDLGISGEHVASMRSDGMVVSTATGSTAYSLSAGGPLVAPGFGGLLVVPLAPHTLVARAIATDSHDVVDLKLGDNSASNESVLYVDGDLIEFDRPIRLVRISTGPVRTIMLQYNHEGFYRHCSNVFFRK